MTAYTQYDIAGNVVKTIDAKDNATIFDYSDSFGAPKPEEDLNSSEARSNDPPQQLNERQSYAFITKITNALGHTAYTQYDYFTGQPVNAEDANGAVAVAYYEDPLDRPTKSVAAANSAALRRRSRVIYDDTNRIITSLGDLEAFGDDKLKSETLYDSLGRTTESRSYESATQYYATRPKYDALGRVVETTNPFRNVTNPALEKTITTYDALSRVTSVTAPDGAQAQTFYDGNRVLVRDAAGQQRMSRTDAVGRLTEVWEITAQDQWTEAVSFPGQPEMKAYRTSYGYDILGNLTQVNQGGQMRYFLYDSLSRLRAAKNPEQLGTVSLTDDFADLSLMSGHFFVSI